jgi:hypothetical protein
MLLTILAFFVKYLTEYGRYIVQFSPPFAPYRKC